MLYLLVFGTREKRKATKNERNVCLHFNLQDMMKQFNCYTAIAVFELGYQRTGST